MQRICFKFYFYAQINMLKNLHFLTSHMEKFHFHVHGSLCPLIIPIISSLMILIFTPHAFEDNKVLMISEKIKLKIKTSQINIQFRHD